MDLTLGFDCRAKRGPDITQELALTGFFRLVQLGK